MANISISLKGIDQAISNLNYRSGSVKQKALLAIRAFYTSEESLKQINSIDTDLLIKSIWDVGDELSIIKSKRRNFSSIKSSINVDLEKLSKKKQNPENIVIADSNIFDMTEEAKNNLLSSFTDAVKTGDINLDQAADILKAVSDFLEKFQIEAKDTGAKDIVNQIKKILNKINADILFEEGLETIDGKDEADGLGKIEEQDEDIKDVKLEEDEALEEIEELDEDIEEIELDEDEVLEEIDELDEDIEEIDADEDIEEVELDEDEVLEEIEDLDEDIEEIELDEDEVLEEIDELDEDIEEIDTDEDSEEVELDENEALEETEELDEDVEEVELDEDEVLEEIEDLDKDIEEIELDEDEVLEEIDELDEDELKALEEYRKKKELAEHFDEVLGEREKKFNKYVIVPEGKYTVGTKKSIKASLELQQFDMPKVYIGVYPVANSLFEIFIEQTGYVTTAERSGYGRVYHSRFKKNANGSTWNKDSGSEDIKGACWYQPLGPDSTLHGKRNHPVVQVSVDDAIAFTSWIGRRLPTEAEWEAAARTDLGYTYPWGNEFNPKALNIEQSGLSDTSAVDEYDAFANEFKITDMLGNVMEWTSDMEIPSMASGKKTKYCIAKGAAWNAKNDVTISSRALFKNGFTSNTIGFRCISEIFL